MAGACDNEMELKSKLLDSKGVSIIKDKIVFIDKKRNCSISVDGHFIYQKQLYLIEVDSYNMAKVVVGQYVLLNQLYDSKVAKCCKSDCIF